MALQASPPKHSLRIKPQKTREKQPQLWS